MVNLPCDLINFNFSKSLSELVKTAPPSPAVSILFPAKLRIDASPKVPVFLLFIEEPIDSAQSSINLILFFFAID